MGLATAIDGFKGCISFLAFKQKPQQGNWGHGARGMPLLILIDSFQHSDNANYDKVTVIPFNQNY